VLALSLLSEALLSGFLLAGILLTGCSDNKAGRRQAAVPVLVDTVVTQPEPLSLNAVGTVEPLEAVAVRAQVGGVITEVNFYEGHEVRAGQVLFQIDPRPLVVALEAAEAQLARDSSQLANAEIQAGRYADLVQKDYVTREQYDAARTQVDVFRSTLQVDRAAVEQARLNLSYASVAAPISGRTGSLLVKKGNLVKANDAALVVINQMRPIRVSFAIPENQLPLVQRYAAGQSRLEVHVKPTSEGAASEQKGFLTFFDNAVDANTGTVTLKGEFANKEGSLLPGQFVDAELVLTVEPSALTIPASAVVTGQEGTFVFVVGGDKRVEKRLVRVSRSINATTVIETGVKKGEVVVTDGQMRLTPGATVEIKTEGRPENERARTKGPAESTQRSTR
jgi:multidrug efflux system membrane fusion protein